MPQGFKLTNPLAVAKPDATDLVELAKEIQKVSKNDSSGSILVDNPITSDIFMQRLPDEDLRWSKHVEILPHNKQMLIH